MATVDLRINVDSKGAVTAVNQIGTKGEQAFRKVGDQADRVNKSVGRTSGVVKDAAKAITTVLLGGGIIAGFTRATRAVAEYEQEVAGLRAVTQATESQMVALRATARDLGATTEFSAQQAAAGMRFLGQAGFETNEIISAIPATLDLATAGSLDLASAADITSNVMSGFNIAADETVRVTDILAITAANANTNIFQMGDAMAYVGPVAAGMSVSVEDTAAAIGVLSDAGIQGTSAGTGLRAVLASLVSPGDAAKQIIRDLGLTIEQVNPETNSLTDIMNRLQGAGLSAGQALQIAGRRGGPALLALVAQNERLEELEGITNDAGGAAAEMAAIIRDTLLGDWRAFISAVMELVLSMGEAGLLEVLRSVIQAMTELARWVPDNAQYIAALAGAIGGLVIARTVVPMVMGLVGALRAGEAAALAKARALGVLRGVLGFLGGPAGAILVAVSAIAAFAFTSRGAADDTGALMAEVAALTGEFESLNQARAEDALIRVQDRMREVGEEMAAVEAMFESMIRRGDVEPGSTAWAEGHEEIKEMRQEIAELGASELQLQAIIDGRTGSQDKAGQSARDLLREMEGLIEGSGELGDVLGEDEVEKFADSLDSMLHQVRRSAAEFERGTRGALEYELQILAAKGATDEEIAALRQKIDVIVQEKQALEEATRARREAERGGGAGGGLPGSDIEGYMEGLDDVKGRMQEIADIEWGIDDLTASFHPLIAEMQTLGDTIAFVDHAMNEGVINGAQAGLLKVGAVADFAFNAIMSGMDKSSKAYEQMAIAQEVVNTALGIAAILQQGQGDPYSAPFRMLAMAAMVASLGVSIAGMSGGGGGSSSESRQESQGTGTVLGDPDAKSESMANSLEIVADATSALVGINRGMLLALQSLQAGIEGASGMIARGAADMDMSGFGLGSSDWGFTSTKLADQGIALLGGAIVDMTEGAVARAFSETRKSNLFSTSYKTHFEELDDEFNSQLNLLFDSMIDAVRAAGESLGIPLEDLEERIASFEFEAQEISLKDLSAEEQQAELEAVFSAIFDDLAAHVVPFVEQFQKVGEGMAEALVRVATNVQVMEEAVLRLGFALDETDPEKFAQAAVGLVEMVGGVDEFITSMSGFVDKFASDAVQFEASQSDMTRALEGVGLEVPESRDALWDLMQTLDAGTVSGREQIAMLLELQETADGYYSFLEAVEKERLGLERQILELTGQTEELRRLELESLDESNRALQERVWALQDEADLADLLAGVGDDAANLAASPLVAEWRNLRREQEELIESAQALGASESELAFIRDVHDQQVAQLIQRLRDSIATLAEQLFGQTQRRQINQVASAESSLHDQRMDQYRRQAQAQDRIGDWLESVLIGDLSPLTVADQFGEAETQFFDAISAALSGDAGAMEDLPGLADQLLELGGQMFGTATERYQELFSAVRDAMTEVEGMDIGPEPTPTAAQVGSIDAGVQQLTISSQEQVALSAQLLEELALLARLTEESIFDLAEEFEVPLRELIETLTGELADNTIETVEQLALVAATMDTSVGELAQQIGVSIGSLEDAESAFSQALQNQVMALPEEFQAELWEPLQNIWNATTEADANAALAELIEATGGLPAEYQNLLAPYFEEIDVTTEAQETNNLLWDIRQYDEQQAAAAGRANTILEKIRHNMEAANQAAGIPSFRVGSAGLPRDMLAQVHKGEKIIDPLSSSILDRYGIEVHGQGGDQDLGPLIKILEQIRDHAERGVDQRETLVIGQDRVAEVVVESGERQADRLERAAERVWDRR